jgi:hypothetical protein
MMMDYIGHNSGNISPNALKLLGHPGFTKSAIILLSDFLFPGSFKKRRLVGQRSLYIYGSSESSERNLNVFENIRKPFHLREMEIDKCSPHNKLFSTWASSIFSNSGILSPNLAAATIGSRQLTALWVNYESQTTGLSCHG